MKEKITKLINSQLIPSLIFLILGLLLALFPSESINLFCRLILSMILISTGCYHILIYLDENRSSGVLDMFTGVLVVVIGGFLFLHPQIAVKLLPLFFGSILIVDSIWVFRDAKFLRKNGFEEWKAFLLGSFLCLILGLVVMLNPFSKLTQSVVFSGIIFIINGIFDLVFWQIYSRRLKSLNAQDAESGSDEETASTVLNSEDEASAAQETYEEYRPNLESSSSVSFEENTALQQSKVPISDSQTVFNEPIALQPTLPTVFQDDTHIEDIEEVPPAEAQVSDVGNSPDSIIVEEEPLEDWKP